MKSLKNDTLDNNAFSQLKSLKDSLSKIESYTWKNSNGSQTKLVNMDSEELQEKFDLCNQILFNQSRATPGKAILHTKVSNILRKIYSEIWLRDHCTETRMALLHSLRGMRNNNGDAGFYSTKHCKNVMLGEILQVDEPFKSLPLSYIMEGCMDSLGVYDFSAISKSFLNQLGICPDAKSKAEYDLARKSDPTLNLEKFFKHKLGLHANVKLNVSLSGLSLQERIVLQTAKNTKYSVLDTPTLKLIADKILQLYIEYLDNQISLWNKIKSNIIAVAEHKGITLTCK